MDQIEKQKKNFFTISIKSPDNNKKFFVFRDKQFEINFGLFKQNSIFFQKYQNQYENVQYINLFQENEIDQFDNISDNAIINFIKLSQNETCQIDNSDIFYIQFLSQKFMVTELSNSIKNIISENYNQLIFESIFFKTRNLDQNENYNEISYFSEQDSRIIAFNLIDYINDERLFNLPISLLYQILTKYSIFNMGNKTNNDDYFNLNDNDNSSSLDMIYFEDDKKVIDFLFRCLDHFGKKASILFTIVNFDRFGKDVIRRLSKHYFNTFDFNLIGSKFLKFALELDQENSKF